MPEGDLDDLRSASSRCAAVEPLTRYDLAYDDPGGLALDLTYDRGDGAPRRDRPSPRPATSTSSAA